MQPSQWIGIALLLLLLGGLVYAFIRPGSKVRPDKSHDPGTAADWSEHSGHSADSSGH